MLSADNIMLSDIMLSADNMFSTDHMVPFILFLGNFTQSNSSEDERISALIRLMTKYKRRYFFALYETSRLHALLHLPS
jgi:hypothetical protein